MMMLLMMILMMLLKMMMLMMLTKIFFLCHPLMLSDTLHSSFDKTCSQCQLKTTTLVMVMNGDIDDECFY